MRSLKLLFAAAVFAILVAAPVAARAAEQTTTTIPIVFVVVADPIGLKLVDSLSRPGRNLTGLSNIGADLSGKRMELLKDAVPASHGWLCLRTPTSR